MCSFFLPRKRSDFTGLLRKDLFFKTLLRFTKLPNPSDVFEYYESSNYYGYYDYFRMRNVCDCKDIPRSSELYAVITSFHFSFMFSLYINVSFMSISIKLEEFLGETETNFILKYSIYETSITFNYTINFNYLLSNDVEISQQNYFSAYA